MSDHFRIIMQCKEIVRQAMDSCKNTIPDVTPTHIMTALVAEAGSGMALLPQHAKDKLFPALVTVMGEEAKLPVMMSKMNDGQPKH